LTGIDYFIQIMGLAIGTSAAISGLVAILSYRREQKRRKEAPTLEDRIRTLTQNLESASGAISEIESEISRRNEIAEKLKNDMERYEQLRELNQPQVEAIAQTIRSEITSESRKSIWRNAIVNFAIALAFFFLGWWVGSL
jgi:transcriptional regulator NrdR family protein